MADAIQMLPPVREDSIEKRVIVMEEGIGVLINQSFLLRKVPSESCIEAERAALLLTEALIRCQVFSVEIVAELITEVVPSERDTSADCVIETWKPVSPNLISTEPVPEEV